MYVGVRYGEDSKKAEKSKDALKCLPEAKVLEWACDNLYSSEENIQALDSFPSIEVKKIY